MKCFGNIKHLLLWEQEVGPPAVKMLISAEGEGLVLPKYEERAATKLVKCRASFLKDDVLVWTCTLRHLTTVGSLLTLALT